MKKMNMLVALFVVLLCSSFTLGKGKGKNKDVYMAGVSASFSDSLIFFTDIQLVDSVELDKDKLLPERQQYSTQLKRFLEGQGMKNRTCFIYFNTNRKKLEKAIRKNIRRADVVFSVRWMPTSSSRKLLFTTPTLKNNEEIVVMFTFCMPALCMQQRE